MSNNATHLIQVYPSKNASVLSRRCDEMVIGVVQQRRLFWGIGWAIAWGDDPGKQDGRVFTSNEGALKALRHIAELDHAAHRGRCCKDCGFAPADVPNCPVNNGGTHILEYGPEARIETEDVEPKVVRPN